MSHLLDKPSGKQSAQMEGVRKRFGDGAVDYSQQRDRQYGFVVQRQIVLDMLDGATGRILDVGCGPGVMLLDLLHRGFEIWGIDLASEMIHLADAKLQDDKSRRRVHLDIGDVEGLEFPDEFFDAAICMGVFEYLLSYDKAIKGLHRVLKPGGIAVITMPTRISPYNIVSGLIAPPYLLAKRALGLPAGSSFKTSRCLPRRLDRQLTAAGLRKLDSAYCNFIFYPLARLCPGISLALNKSMRRFSRSRLLGWLGTQYIVKCQRIV